MAGRFIFCIGDEPKSGLARDLGDCLRSRNVPFGTSGDSNERKQKSLWEIHRLNVREKIRTPDLLVRSQTLYPAELRAHA